MGGMVRAKENEAAGKDGKEATQPPPGRPKKSQSSVFVWLGWAG